MTRNLAIIVLALCVGCEDFTEPEVRQTSMNVGVDIVSIRGCEYIKAQQYGGYVYTHLGNCTNCAARRATNMIVTNNVNVEAQ